MRALSIDRAVSADREESDRVALKVTDEISELYATGPPKPTRLEFCVFRTRIPHYIWTNHSCSLCKCRIRCPCPALCGCCGLCCGGAEDDGCGEWRTCQRLGNLVVLLERVFVEDDPEGYRKEGSELWLVVGPHWPFALLFTAGISLTIPTVSIAVFWRINPHWASLMLASLTGVCLALLLSIACGNPGVAKRVRDKPPSPPPPQPPLDDDGGGGGGGGGGGEGGSGGAGGKDNPPALRWLWNDQANTWRSAKDSYSQEMNVVLQEVDHICPFTGTAIAKRNMGRFIAFQMAMVALALGVLTYIALGLAEAVFGHHPDDQHHH